VAVASTDDGGQWRQIVLQAPDGLGVLTALTATPDGFTAAGVVGRSGSQQTVTWTSPDGLAWSRPAPTADGEITALALTGTTVAGTAEQGGTPTLVSLPAP
jgi:type IV secretory pathway TraG/TraD family ATPase VirD4